MGDSDLGEGPRRARRKQHDDEGVNRQLLEMAERVALVELPPRQTGAPVPRKSAKGRSPVRRKAAASPDVTPKSTPRRAPSRTCTPSPKLAPDLTIDPKAVQPASPMPTFGVRTPVVASTPSPGPGAKRGTCMDVQPLGD